MPELSLQHKEVYDQRDVVLQLNQVIGAIVGCEDRLCQFVLFRWMVDNNLLDKMLEVVCWLFQLYYFVILLLLLLWRWLLL